MKPKFYTKLLTLLAGFMMLAGVNVATAQTVNMERWIELTVKKDANIKLILAGDTDNTAVKIESGSTNETVFVSASFWYLEALECIAGATTMKIYGNVKALACNVNYENITGVNVLNNTGLVTLQCIENNISSLDLTGLTKLQNLSCYDNNLTSLDVSGCTALESLWCYDNNLTSLDVSGCTALKLLWCYNNNLTSLDIRGCTALESLSCYDNNLTSLDVRGCTALEVLECSNNNLTSLDVSGCTALRILECNNINLTSLEVRGLTALSEFYCSDNKLTSLNLAGCTALQEVNCNENNLTSLNVSGCIALEKLYCRNNSLTVLNLGGCNALKAISIRNNNFSTLEIEKIFCSLPHREVADKAAITVLENESDPNKEIVMATTKRNATDKNWNVCYANAENTPIGETSGSYTCPALETYPLWVAGTQVTSANASNILGDSKVSYDDATKTLTLDNAVITKGRVMNDGEVAIHSDIPLTIILRGENIIKDLKAGQYDCGILINSEEKPVVVTGSGSLDINVKSSSGSLPSFCIVSLNNPVTLSCKSLKLSSSHAAMVCEALSITGGTFEARASGNHAIQTDRIQTYSGALLNEGDAAPGTEVNALTLIDGKTKKYVYVRPAEYDLFIKGIMVNGYNAHDILGDGGSVKYDDASKTLTLNGANIDAGDENGINNVGIDNLKIYLKGNNSVSSTSEYPNSAINLLKNTTITGTGSITAQAKFVSIRFESCNLNIEGGCTVIANSEKWGISGIGTTEVLTIKNSIVKATGTTQYSIGGVNNLILEGCEIMQPAGAIFVYKTIGTEAYGAVYVGDNIVNTLVAIAPAYELYIKGEQVTGLNAQDILGNGTGSVKYNNINKTLLLNGADIDAGSAIHGIMNKGIDGLTILLTNNNMVTNSADVYSAISLRSNTTITGSGTLTVTQNSTLTDGMDGITVFDTLTIDGVGKLTATGKRYGIGSISSGAHLIIKNSTVDATGTDYASIGGLTGFTLTLDGAFIEKPVNGEFDAVQGAVVDSSGSIVKDGNTVKISPIKANTITITPPVNGTLKVMNESVEIQSGASVPSGTVLTVTATPNTGYNLSKITANGADITATASFTVTEATTVAAEFASTVGLSEVEAERFITIYPNPAHEKVQIMLSKELNAETLTIADLSGRIIFTEKITDKTMELDVSNYTAGVYLVKAGEVVRRLVVK